MTAVARRLRVAGLVLVLLACLGALLAMLNPAAADAAGGGHVRIAIAGSGAGFTTHPAGPLLDTAGLAPGGSVTGTMGVRNGFEGPSNIFLRMVAVANEENGCTHAESVADGTCGPGQGELAAELVFRFAVATSEHGTYVTRWTGNAAQLERGVAVTRGIAAGQASWVRLAAALPSSAGNETQSDSFGFGVRVTLENTAGVEAIAISGDTDTSGTPPSTGHGVLGLAVTGAQVELLIAAGAVLVAGGLCVLGGASIRRRAARG